MTYLLSCFATQTSSCKRMFDLRNLEATLMQTLIQVIHIGHTVTTDQLGGPFCEEEKEFVIQYSTLEYKWRVAKKDRNGNPMINNNETKTQAKVPNFSLLSFEAPKVAFG